MPKFNRIATVEFKLWDKPTPITVHNVPYLWDSDLDPNNMESEAVITAVKILRQMGVQSGLDCISVTTSPEPS